MTKTNGDRRPQKDGNGSARPQFEAFDATFDSGPDLVCLSHLRWDFVYQRPQHLMSRCARERRVFFFEEPVIGKHSQPKLELTMTPGGVCVAVPHFPERQEGSEGISALSDMLDELFMRCGIHDFILWYYTPMAVPFSRHLKPLATVYDCMDELSAFRGAPPEMRRYEQELLARADVVFTGGHSLYEAKCTRHPNVYSFPSSIEVKHFAQARVLADDPPDQAPIPHPRLGFIGVIDERLDTVLIRSVAELNPDWHIVLVGPIVKIDPASLPRNPNIHYLGARKYEELPAYLAGWDVALLPFARNESTRYISPTKTPEYLAAGRRVVSTSIRDVVRSYGNRGLVQIADTAEEVTAAVKKCLNDSSNDSQWLARVDAVLSEDSWDRTWQRMMSLLESAIESGSSLKNRRLRTPVPAPSLVPSSPPGRPNLSEQEEVPVEDF